MIPPITIQAIWLSYTDKHYTFELEKGVWIKIPVREIWNVWHTTRTPHPEGGVHYLRGSAVDSSNGLFHFNADEVYHIQVDGWWVSDRGQETQDIFQRFRV